jgi:hypothetical protein
LPPLSGPDPVRQGGAFSNTKPGPNEEAIMTKTITGRFVSHEAARNAHEDFIDSGFPIEKVFLERGSTELKVIASSDNEPEVREILTRHKPSEIEVHGAV